MDTIDKWLKSLRLHKYTHLFQSLTYDQMLNLEEQYLIERQVTKGARNKMLVSVKKLNLREERLINLVDDLNQDNISMKEALTVLKDMLITPIPPPPTYELTYLFIGTLVEIGQRLIESAGMEDNACHGIMAAIVDECLKHNSFTKEQKAQVASFKQFFIKEQKAKVASYKQQQQHQHQLLRQQQQQQQQHRPHTYNNNHHHINQQQHQYQNQNHYHHNHHHQQPSPLLQTSPPPVLPSTCATTPSPHQFHHQHHQYSSSNYPTSCHYLHHHNHRTQPPSLSASLSTIGSSTSTTSDEEERHTFKEYTLLGPGMTFELPCLRAMAANERHNRRQLCFLSISQSMDRKSSSCSQA